MDKVRCPGCGQAMLRVVWQGIHHECRTCGGALLGLVPFQEQVVPAEAGRIWRDSEDGPAVGTCPFCDGALHAPRESGDTAGIGVCRRCEQVWVPKAAEPWMRAHAASDANEDPALPPAPAECTNCGAPYSPDADGQCRYCHAQLNGAVPVVVSMPGTVTRERSSVLDLVTDVLFNVAVDDA